MGQRSGAGAAGAGSDVAVCRLGSIKFPNAVTSTPLGGLAEIQKQKAGILTTLQLAVAVDIFKPRILHTAWEGMRDISTKGQRASALRDKGHQLGGTSAACVKSMV